MQIDNALPRDEAAEKILSMLDDEPAAGPPPRPEREGEDVLDDNDDRPASPDDGAVGNPDADGEAETPIDPPASWKADAKARFRELPRELQQVVADREREREQHFSKTQGEVAEARRAAQAERAQAAAERQVTVQGLGAAIAALQTLDPVLAEGAKTDWQKLAASDPKAAQERWARYQERIGVLRAMAGEHARQLDVARAEASRAAHEQLGRALDFWGDADKRAAFRSDLRQFLGANGFDGPEVDGLADPRAILVARKAMLYDKLMEQQARIAKAKSPQAANRVMKPNASDDDRTGRAEGLLKRAARSGRIDDAAAAILAALD
jgi:hypothetical protein